jgi:hypothetical protein
MGSGEPFAAVGQPPTEGEQRERGGESPPEREDQVGHEAEHPKGQPEDFALHGNSVARGSGGPGSLWQLVRNCDRR